MEELRGERIRVTLRWIQILDNLEPAWKERGEFRFSANVSSRNGNVRQETRFPEEGHYEISDHPAWNKMNLDKVLFDGMVTDHLEVELRGEELDMLSANDQLDHYTREFEGPPASWIGQYQPHDEESDDPENMTNWRICYEIQKV